MFDYYRFYDEGLTLHKRQSFAWRIIFSSCDHIRSILRIWSHLLKKSLMQNFIFLCVIDFSWENCGRRFWIYWFSFTNIPPEESIDICTNTLSEGLSKICKKQSFKGVLRKMCSENMQKIYWRTPMLKCDFNKVAKKLYLNHIFA